MLRSCQPVAADFRLIIALTHFGFPEGQTGNVNARQDGVDDVPEPAFSCSTRTHTGVSLQAAIVITRTVRKAESWHFKNWIWIWWRWPKDDGFFFLENWHSPSQSGSVDRASACGLKVPGFDSHQGHRPWLQVPRPWTGRAQEATNRCVSLTSMFLSVSLSPFHSL
uniref:Uncharacterized protein n=1 Tax=Myotis myotis TaxID=51298 RepID=A0A7J7RSE2_MYOMY|nr:hypothetical protein mMyoMyo1_010209 [Myotis myotis]